MTFGAVLAAVAGIGVLVGLPTAFSALGLSKYAAQLAHLCGIAGLFVFVLLILVLFYRIGPAPHPDGVGPVLPGAFTAAVLWLLVSVLFSFYVSNIASYSATYGPLGAAVGVMMWFYVERLCGAVRRRTQCADRQARAPEKAPPATRGGEERGDGLPASRPRWHVWRPAGQKGAGAQGLGRAVAPVEAAG